MSRGRRTRGVRIPAIVSAVIMFLLLGGCAGDGDDSRPLSTEEVELLALTRFRNFDAGVREVTFAVTDSGTRYEVDAWVDFPAGAGYGTVAIPGEESSTLAWTGQGVATGAPSPPGAAPLPPPADGWTSSSLAPEQSRLHAVLAVLISLGSDRPDNPVLLAQTDARWLREDSVAGTDVTVFRGPSSDTVETVATAEPPDTDGATAEVRYWVGADSTLHRLELALGGGAEWAVVDLVDAPDVTFDLSQLN
ncbi:hypothetical protein [Ruania halotolerans]|uniref:hypothetical protein n=1 Tax=Ruania halotolerans TaxID=2897773 RepID=UPI001E63DAD0|nr:hypothetical protein [Ruania halotolerans]UFU06794.1 hypothetical protein LQF10_01380 [Ruania halotolerans]